MTRLARSLLFLTLALAAHVAWPGPARAGIIEGDLSGPNISTIQLPDFRAADATTFRDSLVAADGPVPAMIDFSNLVDVSSATDAATRSFKTREWLVVDVMFPASAGVIGVEVSWTIGPIDPFDLNFFHVYTSAATSGTNFRLDPDAPGFTALATGGDRIKFLEIDAPAGFLTFGPIRIMTVDPAVAVPEPGTWVVMGIGGLMIGGWRAGRRSPAR